MENESVNKYPTPTDEIAPIVRPSSNPPGIFPLILGIVVVVSLLVLGLFVYFGINKNNSQTSIRSQSPVQEKIVNIPIETQDPQITELIMLKLPTGWIQEVDYINNILKVLPPDHVNNSSEKTDAVAIEF